MSLFSGALDYVFGHGDKVRVHLRDKVGEHTASIEGTLDGADNIGIALREAMHPDGSGEVFVPWGAIQYIMRGN